MTSASSAAERWHRATSYADRVLKVDHAGENGAVNIYRGQIWIARWRAPSAVRELAGVLVDEIRHRNVLKEKMEARRLRRCRSYYLCGVGGLALGLLTGLLGMSAIAVTTVAVEQVVLAHMHEQLRVLKTSDPDAHSAIAAIVGDEQAHHDEAIDQAKAGAIWSVVLAPVIRFGTECVIWLGMRI